MIEKRCGRLSDAELNLDEFFDRDRCYGVMGTASRGPVYCGNKAKGIDGNGRPVCGVHARRNEGIEWFGERGRYPHGLGGSWRFNRR